ncbi:phosphotransferase [candidate division KSB3 bacterium]|uniref:Phosphotransferase n=1 Tax=candidate division KSB3 bacterium TaxID=2044937 RepID=A0A9D5JY78_9BACT|nr:phosphotransferase [candidate division KSB3 bacterium]MBD3326166.1 phosphotransferase [candidate division KSB3 bacterium]
MQPFSYDTLTACIRRHLGDTGEPISFTPIPTGKFNTSYYVQTAGQDLILRIAPPQDAVFVFYEKDMMKQEPGIHRLLLEQTHVPVARILAFDESHAVLDHDFLIMERLPGHPLSEAMFVDESTVLQQVGDALAQTHRITADQYGYLGAHAPMPPQATWNEAFWMMWRTLIEDVAGVDYYTSEECQQLLSLLEAHLPLFDRDVPSSLLHMGRLESEYFDR